MEKKIAENYRRYLERVNLYKKFGYDIENERKFILEKAQPIYGNILEVGTGKGYFTLVLAKKGYTFTSIDISEEEQKFARLNIKYFGLENQVDFRIMNAENLDFEDNSFDIIFLINTIHHLDNPYRVIDELIRVVSFEGKIILSDFTNEGLEIMNKIHTRRGSSHEVNNVVLSDIDNYLIKKEFKIQKYRSKFQEISIAYRQII